MTKRGIIWAAVSTLPQADEEEKFSIPKQIADGTAFFAQQGIRVVDTLIVPGHSRSYRTLELLAADARKRNIDAFDKLIDYLKTCEFDVFWCRDANRFARKASLLHYIVEMIVEECHAVIYSQNDGLWVDEKNMDMWATMKGYSVRAEVKWLVSATRDGLKKRAERGLTTTHVPFSHLLIRDERLKPIRVEVDESKRRLFDDLHRLIVDERMPFNGIEKILYERFGHVAKDGKPYGDNIMYYFLHHPLTWGITTYGVNRKSNRSNFLGRWTFDDSEPPPPEVDVFRDTVTPVYQGEQADALRAELIRRKDMVGRRRPDNTTAFSGLFICGKCFYTMVVRTNDYGRARRTPYALQCNSSRNHFQFRPDCDERASVSIKRIREYVETLLVQMIETRDLSLLIPEAKNLEQQIALVQAEASELRATLDNLIRLQAGAHVSTQTAYQRTIDETGQQLERVERAVRRLQSEQQRQRAERQTAGAALDAIAAYGDDFWGLDEAVINQLLRRLLGPYRFVVIGGEVQGVMIKPSNQRRKTKPADDNA